LLGQSAGPNVSIHLKKLYAGIYSVVFDKQF